MEDGKIDMVSTSRNSADVPTIVLQRTERIQSSFVPRIVNNITNPDNKVSGELVYERKSVNEEEFPTETLARGTLRIGEQMRISLNTSETRTLFLGLCDLYGLAHGLEGIPQGHTSFVKVGDEYKMIENLLQTISSGERTLQQVERYELISQLLKIATDRDSLEALNSVLKELGDSSFAALTNALNIGRLERTIQYLEANMDNGCEEDWQNLFTSHQWILSQVFASPYTIFQSKAYVGGKGLTNTGGNLCDFVYQNKLTLNLALVEIKTPCTHLLGSAYRNTYSLSADMSGAINQILHYRDQFIKNYNSIRHDTSDDFELFFPKCILIIGKVQNLSRDQIQALDNYRNILTGITIVTYDELLERVKGMLSMFNTGHAPNE